VYINGATAEDCEKKIKTPSNKNIMMIGASHHFFLALKKSQNSRSKDTLLIEPPLNEHITYEHL